MAINLSKGARINLGKEAPTLKNLLIKLNWEPQSRNGAEFDLDTSVFLTKLDATGAPKLVDDNHFIFYNNKTSPCGGVVHSGDDKTGAAGEEINIDLAKVNAAVEEVAFIVTIHEADARSQNFGQVPKSSIELLDADTGVSIARYDLEEDFSTETAIEFGTLYRKDAGWAFKAVGTGHTLGLAEFVRGYGGDC